MEIKESAIIIEALEMLLENMHKTEIRYKNYLNDEYYKKEKLTREILSKQLDVYYDKDERYPF